MAASMEIRPGDRVLDIGTGSGILAIIAAKLGGVVSATDISPDAIRAAGKNAELNDVGISLRRGSYFAGLDENFDVIIANLPQEIVPASYRRALGPKLSRTIDSGKHGNRHLMRFLNLAKGHLHENTRLYLPVYTAADYASTMRKILSGYNARLVAFEEFPTKEFVPNNLGYFRRLDNSGKVRIFRRGKDWIAQAYLFEITRKKILVSRPFGMQVPSFPNT